MNLFCKHDYKPIENNYAMLGWYKCPYCGKELEYIGQICKCELNTDTENCEYDSRDL